MRASASAIDASEYPANVDGTPVVRDAFGAGMQDVFTRLKQTERAEFERIVTSLDHLWYAQVA